MANTVRGFRPITDNVNGVYAFPAVLEGGYEIIGSAAGFNGNSVAFDVEPAEIKSVVIALGAVGGEGEGGKDPGRPASCGPSAADGSL